MKKLFWMICITLSFWADQSQAKIPFTEARGVYEGTKDEYKAISPFWGIVAINGMLEQIRFFGHYEKGKEKDRIVDKGRDPIAQLIRELFPSPDGVQFVANTCTGDLVGWLSRNLDKINDIIRILVNKSLSKNKKAAAIQSLLKDNGAEGNIQNFANLLINADQIQNRLANPKKPLEQLYPENIVIIALLGFFAKVADSSQDFKKLTVLMKNDFEPSPPFKREEYDEALEDPEVMNILQKSTELVFLMAKGYDVFENPFMKPIQYRGDTCFKTSQGFSDCGETSLRNIFMMLLGEKGTITEEALKNLQKNIDPIDSVDLDDPNIPFQKLLTFFQNNPYLANAATKESHDDWAEVVSDLNRQEELGTLQAVQYGHGDTEEQKETHIYEIKASASNIGVNGIINMLNVIAKIIPDKKLNVSWSEDKKQRFKQATQKITRFCKLFSRKNVREVSWLNKDTSEPKISEPFGTLTLYINGEPAYDWTFIPRHFQIDPYKSSENDWRLHYENHSFPNEWLAYFYRNLDEKKLIENDKIFNTDLPLTYIYNKNLRNLDGVLQTITFVLYKVMDNQFKQFVDLFPRWIDISVPLNDNHAVQGLASLLYAPLQHSQTKRVLEPLKKIEKMDPVIRQLEQLNHQDSSSVIDVLSKAESPMGLVLMAKHLGPDGSISLNLTKNKTVTGDIIRKVHELTQLVSLDLTKNKKITDEDLQHMTNLKYLNLEENKIISDAGLQNLQKLKGLNLAWNKRITDTGLEHLPNLTELNLNWNREISDEALQKLTTLKHLELKDNGTITDASLQNLTDLVFLNLEYNQKVTNHVLKKLTNLKYLSLYGCNYGNITDKGLENLTKLETLDLRWNKMITSKGLKSLKNLKILVLGSNKNFTTNDLAGLPNLEKVVLTNNNDAITNDEFQEQLPYVQIIRTER